MNKVMVNSNASAMNKLYKEFLPGNLYQRASDIISTPLSFTYTQGQKVKNLLDLGAKPFNHVIFELSKSTNLPVSYLNDFPLLDNDDILVRDDIFRILEESGVGVPQYYKEVAYEINGKNGKYNRSRSGCFFCFFQQKIEWVWLYEQNPAKFFLAMEYEKDGYTWNQSERLEELINPERIKQIKEEFLTKQTLAKQRKQSSKLFDILDSEEEGCAACFI